MIDLGTAIVIKHTWGIFTWMSSRWEGPPICHIAVELAYELGWQYFNTDLRIGPYRILVFDLHDTTLSGFRLSNHREERVREFFLILNDLWRSGRKNLIPFLKAHVKSWSKHLSPRR